jgi:hypothetical protein
LQALCRRHDLQFYESALAGTIANIPPLLTPGAAEALAVKIYRAVQANGKTPAQALADSLVGYQNPISPEILEAQIALAVAEASDLDFVPACFRSPILPHHHPQASGPSGT